METISVSKLKDLVENDNTKFLLIDVRTPSEYNSGHISVAHNFPLDNLQKEIIEKLSIGKQVITVCKSGGRSVKACDKLSSFGFENVATVQGGTDAWKESGYETAGSGESVMSIERQVRISAGTLVLIGVILGFVLSPVFFGISAFVGAGLIFAGITDWCGMGLFLMKMPWNNREEKICQKN